MARAPGEGIRSETQNNRLSDVDDACQEEIDECYSNRSPRRHTDPVDSAVRSKGRRSNNQILQAQEEEGRSTVRR